MKRDQEAAHSSYKTDPEGSNSLQRGGPPHGQDVWHPDICMGERKGRRQEALVGFHVPQEHRPSRGFGRERWHGARAVVTDAMVEPSPLKFQRSTALSLASAKNQATYPGHRLWYWDLNLGTRVESRELIGHAMLLS